MVELIRFGNHFVRVSIGNDMMIYNSYKVTSLKDMKSVINYIHRNYLFQKDTNRTKFDMVNEWRAHNLLYTLGMFRSHTKDVNFEYRQSVTLKILYAIISLFYFHFK